jgi:autotransporter passenger strand-loop-strand repeat protein
VTTVSSSQTFNISSGQSDDGDVVLSGGILEVLSGGSATNATIVGIEVVSSGGADIGATVSAGGYQQVFSGGVATAATIQSGGYEYVNSGAAASSTTVDSGGLEMIIPGGMGDGATVASGGTIVLESGGLLSGTIVLNGGVIDLSNPSDFSGTLTNPTLGAALNFGSAVVTDAEIAGSNFDITIGGTVYQFAVNGLPQGSMLQIEDNGHSVVVAPLDPLGLSDTGDTATYSQGGAPTALDGNLVLSDSSGASLVSATVSIGSGFLAGDVLAANTSGTNISASYDPTTGVLTLSGTDSLSDYQAVLNSVTFTAAAFDPTAGGSDTSRTIIWAVGDGTNVSSDVASVVDLIAAEAPPVISQVGNIVRYVQGSGAQSLLDAGLTLADSSGATLTSATVSITQGFLSGDTLSADTQGTGISASYDAANGVLTLTGAASAAVYQQVLDSVIYGAQSFDPTAAGQDAARTISWVVSDGITASAPVVTTIQESLSSALQQLNSATIQGARTLAAAISGGAASGEVLADAANLFASTVVGGGIAAAGDIVQQAYGSSLSAAEAFASYVSGGVSAQIASAGEALVNDVVSGALGPLNSSLQLAYGDGEQAAATLQSIVSAGGTANEVLSSTLGLYDSVVAGAVGAVGQDAQQAYSTLSGSLSSLASMITSGADLSQIDSAVSGLYSNLQGTISGTVSGWTQAYDDSLQAASALENAISGGSVTDVTSATTALYNSVVSAALGQIGGANWQQAANTISQGLDAISSDIASGASADALLSDANNVIESGISGVLNAVGGASVASVFDSTEQAASLLNSVISGGSAADVIQSAADGLLSASVSGIVGIVGGTAAVQAYDYTMSAAETLGNDISNFSSGDATQLLIDGLGAYAGVTTGDIKAAIQIVSEIEDGLQYLSDVTSTVSDIIDNGLSAVNGDTITTVAGALGLSVGLPDFVGYNAEYESLGLGMSVPWFVPFPDPFDPYIPVFATWGVSETDNEQIVLPVGVAFATSLGSGGRQDVYAAGAAIGTQVGGGGVEVVENGGIDITAVIEGGGKQYVNGTAQSTFVWNGGYQEIDEGGVAYGANVQAGGTQTVESGGTIVGTSLARGGHLNLLGGFIADATMISAATLVQVSGGVVLDGYTLNSGVNWDVWAGGSVGAVTINGGGITIEFGGTASGTTIESRGVQVVSGETDDTTINSGGAQVVAGGAANGTAINSSGAQIVTYGAASNTTINNSGVQVISSGEADSTTISSGGAQIVSGGTANGTTINSGGFQIVVYGAASSSTVNISGAQIVSGGEADSTTINSGGAQVISGGAANGTTINDNGTQIVSNGEAYGTTINSGGSQQDEGLDYYATINNGGVQTVSGLADNDTVNSGGFQNVISSGIANGIVIDGGVQYLQGSASGTIVISGGLQNVTSTGQAEATTISGGQQDDHNIAEDTVISDGGTQNVDATAYVTSILDSGVQNVRLGGTAYATTVYAGGYQDVLFGGVASGSVVSSGGEQVVSGTDLNAVVFSGGVQTVAIGGTAESTTMLNDYSPYSPAEQDVYGSAIGTLAQYSLQIVESGGVASGTTATQGTFIPSITNQYLLGQIVSSGGLALDATINGGAQVVYGTAIGTTFKGQAAQFVESGGTVVETVFAANSEVTQYVYGGTATNETLNGNSQYVSGGEVVGTTVLGGGRQYISAGGVASNTLLASGYQYLSGGATAINTVVGGGDYQYSEQVLADSGCTATSTTINNNGMQLLTVPGDETANHTTINSGGVQEVGQQEYSTEPYYVTDTIINYGGLQQLFGQGVVSHTTVNSGGVQEIDSPGWVAIDTTISGGYQEVWYGASASSTTIDENGSQTVYGSTYDTKINNGGVQTVDQATASQTTINDGGQQIINGGTLTNTIVDGGVQSGFGTFDGTIIENGGLQTFAGLATDTTITSGGTQIATADFGVAAITSGTVIENGGVQCLSSGGYGSDTTIYGGGCQIVSFGGMAYNTVLSGGAQVVSSRGYASATTIFAGGELYNDAGTFIAQTVISSGGNATDYGSAQSTNIAFGGIENVFGYDQGAVIQSGGTQFVNSGATTNGSIILGGVVVVANGGVAEWVTFGQPSGTLELDSPTGLAGDVANWQVGDTLDFVNTEVTSASFDGSYLTITTGDGQAYSYAVDYYQVYQPPQSGTKANVISDGAGGSDVILVSPSNTPLAPTLSDVSVVSGYVNAANDALSHSLTGIAEAGDTINVYLNGATTPAFMTTADGSGNWIVTLGQLPDGSYSYTATATDATGNVSAPSAPLSFTVDTQAPSVPTLADSSVVSGYVNLANDTERQKLSGTAEAGSTVTVSGLAAPLTTTADGSGNWSVTLGALADGSFDLTATATDAAGNESQPSADYTFTIDTTPPSPPTVANALDPSNASYDAGFTVAAGAAVTVTVNGSQLSPAQLVADFAKTTSGGLDTYTAQPNAFTGAESIAVSATLTDAAGNVSAPGTLALKPIDTTPPSPPAITSASYAGSGKSAHWNLGGTAEAGSTVTVNDGTTKLGTIAAAGGSWTFPTTENNTAIRDFTVTATDVAGNTSVPSKAYFEGTPGNDTFNFASEAALSIADLINGGLGTNTVKMTSPVMLTDADFAHFQSIETLGLTGASSVTLGANASADGLGTFITGVGATSVIDSNTGTLTVNAAALGTGNMLTLSGPTADTVTNLTGNMSAASETGTLTVTATGTTAQTIATGSGNISIADSTTGSSVTVNGAALASTSTLNLTGSRPETVTNFSAGTINAAGLSGALNVTTGALTTGSIATGTGSNTITASAMTSGTLTLTGANNATVSIGGTLNASRDKGSLAVTATGTNAHTLQTGSGNDSITATHGGDAIQGGGGGDTITVSGHSAADTFVYAATSDSLNTNGHSDKINGFAAGGPLNDLLDFHSLNPSLSIQGQLTGNTVNADSIAWLYSGGNAMVFINDTTGPLKTSTNSLMEMTLNGVSSGLSMTPNINFKV